MTIRGDHGEACDRASFGDNPAPACSGICFEAGRGKARIKNFSSCGILDAPSGFFGGHVDYAIVERAVIDRCVEAC